MNINVPEYARESFWDEPPEGSWEFWAFRFRPPCEIDEPLFFKFNKKVVAKAIVARIEPPGQSKCEHSGNYENRWKVFWTPESFVDLRFDMDTRLKLAGTKNENI